MKNNRDNIIAVLVKEESFSPDFEKKVCDKMQRYIDDGLTGEELFTLYDTFGFSELMEEAYKQGIKLSDNYEEFVTKMDEQRQAL